MTDPRGPGRMLYSERSAYARMGRWQPVHLLIRRSYFGHSDSRAARLFWRTYRRFWP